MARCALGGCWLLAVLAGLLPAATAITGPVAGYTVESPGPVLRAILGVPGSFRFSDPIPLPDGVTRIHMAPGQDFALAELAGSGIAVLSLASGAVAGVAGIEGAIAPDWTAFSPQASSAILFSAATSRLQVLTGLPATPHIALDMDTNALTDIPRTGVVSDNGQTLLLATREALYRVPLDGSAAQVLMAAHEIVSLAFFRNGTDAAVWDGGTESIHLLQNVPSALVDRVLASGLKGAGELYPSWDGASIFLIRPGTRNVSAISLASGEIQSFDSAAPVDTLVPLRNHDAFLISAERHQPAWMFYLDGSLGRVVFVPAWDRSPKPVTGSRQ